MHCWVIVSHSSSPKQPQSVQQVSPGLQVPSPQVVQSVGHVRISPASHVPSPQVVVWHIASTGLHTPSPGQPQSAQQDAWSSSPEHSPSPHTAQSAAQEAVVSSMSHVPSPHMETGRQMRSQAKPSGQPQSVQQVAVVSSPVHWASPHTEQSAAHPARSSPSSHVPSPHTVSERHRSWLGSQEVPAGQAQSVQQVALVSAPVHWPSPHTVQSLGQLMKFSSPVQVPSPQLLRSSGQSPGHVVLSSPPSHRSSPQMGQVSSSRRRRTVTVVSFTKLFSSSRSNTPRTWIWTSVVAHTESVARVMSLSREYSTWSLSVCASSL